MLARTLIPVLVEVVVDTQPSLTIQQPPETASPLLLALGEQRGPARRLADLEEQPLLAHIAQVVAVAAQLQALLLRQAVLAAQALLIMAVPVAKERH